MGLIDVLTRCVDGKHGKPYPGDGGGGGGGGGGVELL